MRIGIHERSIDDSRVVSVDFTKELDFVASPITGATITPAGTLVAGPPDFTTTPNVVAFRLSGGTVDTAELVEVQVTNGTDIMCVSLVVKTAAC